MDATINQLVQLDQKAREMVDEANDYLSKTLNNIDQDVAQFKEGYKQKAMHRIGIIREEEGRLSQEAYQDMSGRYQALMENLDKSYETNHRRWEKELFDRVVGR